MATKRSRTTTIEEDRTIIRSTRKKVFADRKIFFLDLKENDRGRFVKITEDVRGRRDTIMLPTEVLEEFIGALQNISEANDDNE